MLRGCSGLPAGRAGESPQCPPILTPQDRRGEGPPGGAGARPCRAFAVAQRHTPGEMVCRLVIPARAGQSAFALAVFGGGFRRDAGIGAAFPAELYFAAPVCRLFDNRLLRAGPAPLRMTFAIGAPARIVDVIAAVERAHALRLCHALLDIDVANGRAGGNSRPTHTGWNLRAVPTGGDDGAIISGNRLIFPGPRPNARGHFLPSCRIGDDGRFPSESGKTRRLLAPYHQIAFVAAGCLTTGMAI